MSQEFTTYRSVFDKSEYIKQGYIITYDDLDSVDDLPELSTLERQDIYHARTGDLSSDYIVPVDTDGSGSFDEWRSLVDGSNIAIPDNLVDNFESAEEEPIGPYESGDDISSFYADISGGSFERSESSLIEGDFVIARTDSSSGSRRISEEGDGLLNYPDEGESVSMILEDTGQDAMVGAGCPSKNENSGYWMIYRSTTDVEIEVRDDGDRVERYRDENVSGLDGLAEFVIKPPETGDNTLLGAVWSLDDDLNRIEQVTRFEETDDLFAGETGLGWGCLSSSGTGEFGDLLRVGRSID